MKLEEGKYYKLPGGDFIQVLDVNWSWALVRPPRKIRKEFETARGQLVTFDAPAGAYTISANSILEEVDEVIATSTSTEPG